MFLKSSSIFLSLVFLLEISSSSVAASNLVERPKRPLFQAISVSALTDSTRELAEQLEILPLLNELYDQENKPTIERATTLRQKILETTLESYFDAQSVQAEAEREQVRLENIREVVIAARDRKIQINNASNFIASGTLNTVGSILGFTNRIPPFPGNLNQMLSGVVSTGMSMYALKQGAGGKTKGLDTPTVAAELFGRPTDDRTAYPESVWRFLHGKSPEHPGLSRAQWLEKRWVERNELERFHSPREKVKIDLICGVPNAGRLMTVDDLNDQIAIISDISLMASLMVHHLRDLLRMIDSDISL